MDALPALEFVDRPAAAFAAEVRNTGNRKSGEAELCDTTGMHVDHREILATAFSILAVRCDWSSTAALNERIKSATSSFGSIGCGIACPMLDAA